MILNIQQQLKQNPIYLKYLRENSIWYKYLNRDPNSFKTFQEEVKTNYKLKTTDKISKAMSTFEMVQSIITSLK